MYDDPALHAELTALRRADHPGRLVATRSGQKLVQLTMPGVPDVYQGTELWDNSLVDPDNRRPVDFAGCAGSCWPGSTPAGCRRSTPSGAAKLLVVSRTLRLRRDRPELFTGYRPVPAHGPAGRHAVAFDRGGAIAVATRLPLRAGPRAAAGATPPCHCPLTR